MLLKHTMNVTLLLVLNCVLRSHYDNYDDTYSYQNNGLYDVEGRNVWKEAKHIVPKASHMTLDGELIMKMGMQSKKLQQKRGGKLEGLSLLDPTNWNSEEEAMYDCKYHEVGSSPTGHSWNTPEEH